MSEQQFPTSYDPKELEERWYRFWEEQGFFYAEGFWNGLTQSCAKQHSF
ncbi:hypothetical protein GG496_002029, partial [Candidatus Fervidibacteria bacterium JGI MDM2 JNZ-1-D12]